MNPVDTSLFHYKPYELKWHPPHQDHNIKLYDELFMSTTFLNAHQALQDTPPESDCDLPCVVIALMFWLGSTQLTIFGDTKLWLLYFFFDNESKYLRCQPTNDLCSHAMYFQMVSAQSFCEAVISHLFQVSNELKDFLAENLDNKPLTEVLHTYCQWEFFHKQWKILLDEVQKPMSTELSSCVATASSNTSIPKYLHTLLIIPKSVFPIVWTIH